MTALRTVAATAVVALSLSACAPASSARKGPMTARDEPARVRVTNNNWANVTVYLVRSGMRVRLGDVTSMRTAIFRVPRTAVGAASDVRLVADPIGSRDTFVTQPIMISPGQTVKFTVENHLAISNVAVWDE